MQFQIRYANDYLAYRLRRRSMSKDIHVFYTHLHTHKLGLC